MVQEEYAIQIDNIIDRDVFSFKQDWFNIDRKTFMLDENKDKTFIIGTRNTGCDMIIFDGTINEIDIDRVFGCLGNTKFYLCEPTSLYESRRNINEVGALYAFKELTYYARKFGKVPVFEGCHCKLIELN